MWKYLFLFLTCARCSIGQSVSNVKLLNHQGYLVDLMQATMNEIEEEMGWCNLKIPDFNRTIDQSIYGWDLQGTVHYKNGFLLSVKEMDLWEQTVQQLWGHSSATNTSTVLVRGTLRLHEASVGYDVELDLIDGEKHFYTGVYTHELIRHVVAITKNLQENTLEARVTIDSLSAGTSRKMIYRPNDHISEVLQREYQASSAYDAVQMWGSDIIQPVMQNLARTRIQFPETCYNCPIV